MTDVRILSKATLRNTVADWLLTPAGNLDESLELANIAKVALMSDRTSEKDEIRPDPDSDDRRGWWGDHEAEIIWDGWPIGTKNWLLTRAKINDQYSFEGDTVFRAEQYTREALQPLIAKKICTRIDVKAERADIDRIHVTVVLFRGPEEEISLEFQALWDEVREF